MLRRRLCVVLLLAVTGASSARAVEAPESVPAPVLEVLDLYAAGDVDALIARLDPAVVTFDGAAPDSGRAMFTALSRFGRLEAVGEPKIVRESLNLADPLSAEGATPLVTYQFEGTHESGRRTKVSVTFRDEGGGLVAFNVVPEAPALGGDPDRPRVALTTPGVDPRQAGLGERFLQAFEQAGRNRGDCSLRAKLGDDVYWDLLPEATLCDMARTLHDQYGVVLTSEADGTMRVVDARTLEPLGGPIAIYFRTTFAEGVTVWRKVTMVEIDGLWRVAGVKYEQR